MKENGRLYATVPSYSFLWSEEDILAGHFRRYTLKGLSKTCLIQVVLELQELVHLQKSDLNEKDNKIDELTEQLTKLNEEQEKQKTQAINKEVNKPSSKKPEWDKDGNPKNGKQRKRKTQLGTHHPRTPSAHCSKFKAIHQRAGKQFEHPGQYHYGKIGCNVRSTDPLTGQPGRN